MASGKLPLLAKSSDPSVPFERVVSMVRHLTHDARNGLNSVDLQAAYVAELVTGEEARAEVKQLRAMITSTAKLLQALSARFWVAAPQFVTYSARIFMEDFRDRLKRVLADNAAHIVWTEDVSEQMIRVDIEMIFSGLSEFFKNAFDFREEDGKISAHAETKDGRFVIELRERKITLPSPVDQWGIEPLLSTRRTGYGLGLYHARQILALHGAELTFAHDTEAAELATRIAFPLSEK
jgi:nitrogen fixation/metabolism regulation signal transduction histidine kinase